MDRLSVRDSVKRNVKRYREKSGMSQKELADHLGLNPSTVAHWETGKSSPSADTIGKLCEMFSVTPVVFMGIADEGASLEEQNAALLELYWAAPEHIRMAVDALLRQG
jgi:transcriptional regulator with XRE-family HTH domain